MRHTRFWSVLAIVSAQACAAPVEDLPEGAAEAAAATITEADFMTRVGVIAHDSMLGRNTPSPQLDLTAQYIAGEFERMGLEPGLGNSYIQTYPIRRSRLDTETSGVEFQGATLRFGADAAARRASPTGESGVSGPAVLVTGTTEDPAAFDELDLEGKMVVAITASSQTNTWRRALGAQGPAGMVFVTDIDDENMEGLMNFTTRESVTKGWGEAGAGGRAPMVEVRRSAVQPALEALGVDVADALSNPGALLATPLDDTEITITIVHEILEETTAPNVVAVLEGRDPKLRDEYVVFSGHMDHVGVGNPVNGDSIYNGADDDASGTIAVVEIAEAFSQMAQPPRRSMIFLLVSGEEKGLWGSEYYADNPTVPIEDIVANLNTDMVGRNWPDTIVAIGKEHSDLGETMNRVNEAHPELGMTAIDDIWPGERFYFRSDHYNFARNGVPILFFFNGVHEDYHRPSDHVDKIDGEKAARLSQLVFYLGVEIGEAAERPEWNPESYAQIVESRR